MTTWLSIALLVGFLAGLGFAWLLLWLEERRIKKVELDDAWVRFTRTETSGHRRRVP